jgi:hypothetical protein
MDQITSSAGLAPLESSLSGQVLVVGVLLPHGYHTFITETERSLFYLFPGDDPG